LSASVRCAPGAISRFLHGVLPRFVEVCQRELSAFVGICGNLSEVARPTIGLRPCLDSFGFKLTRKRDQPSLYFDVTGRECKLAALLDFMAIL
jgi:hypothetical protein